MFAPDRAPDRNGVALSQPAAARPLVLWALRLVWVTLPITAGPAVSTALRDWSEAPRVVAEALLWAVWALGLLAAVAPRPRALTAMRVVALAFFVITVASAFDAAPSTLAKVGALVATAAALALASSHDAGLAAANALAYGDEVRVLLRTPPALFVGPIPLARLVVATAVAAPPLLLADERWVVGTFALAVAVPVVFVLGRALQGLSERWCVLVPAGLVIVDPLTLSDPVLFLRERIVSLRAAGAVPVPAGMLDLRLGAAAGGVAMTFDEEAELPRRGRGRRGGETVHTSEVWFAVVRRTALLSTAGARRIRVQ